MEKLVVAGIDLSGLLNVPYAGGRHPLKITILEFLLSLGEGANCELFALAILRIAGFYVEEKRSIELWHDTDFTVEVEGVGPYQPFDIFFFLPRGADPHRVEEEVLKGFFEEGGQNGIDLNELKRFHLGVYIGSVDSSEHCIFHLPKPGPSTIWPLEYFSRSDKEYWLFKVKRPFRKRERLTGGEPFLGA